MPNPEPISIRKPVMILGTLLLLATGLVVASQAVAPVEAHRGAVKILAQRDLRFADRADLGVEVTNAADGSVIAELPPESNNFLRALMRGLVRQRVREAIGPEIPFRLTAWADGHLTLEDSATHRLVALEAFGPTNAVVFAQLLPLKMVTQ